jgi:hypothetical protein
VPKFKVNFQSQKSAHINSSKLKMEAEISFASSVHFFHIALLHTTLQWNSYILLRYNEYQPGIIFTLYNINAEYIQVFWSVTLYSLAVMLFVDVSKDHISVMTQPNIPEDLGLQWRCYRNLKFSNLKCTKTANLKFWQQWLPFGTWRGLVWYVHPYVTLKKVYAVDCNRYRSRRENVKYPPENYTQA